MTFTCPVCEKTSHHPKDEEYGYCGRCKTFTGDEAARLTYLRAVMLSEAPMRQSAEAVVEAILSELAGHDADDPVPPWEQEDGEPLLPEWAREFTVGELRSRLRVMLEDLAAADMRRRRDG